MNRLVSSRRLAAPLFVAPASACVQETTAGSVPAGTHSLLWGREGERWSASGRLPDFSFAGYRRGEEPYRIPAEHVSVANFGARGDGVADDTEAFEQAIAQGAGKVVHIPPGRYRLGTILRIRSSGVVLRGEGSGRTTLLFTRSMEDVQPNPSTTTCGRATTAWSWSGGLITVGESGSPSEPFVARVIEGARRGDEGLRVAGHDFFANDEIELELSDPAEGTLPRHLYRDDPGELDNLELHPVRQVFRVRAVRGDTLELDRPLRFDVREEWGPRLRFFRPAVTDVGIEGLRIEFPSGSYQGHFSERGWNALEFQSNAAHCWARDLEIVDADSGIYTNGASFCTLERIRLSATPGRADKQGMNGHHGITLIGSDNLCTDFVIDTVFFHDLGLQESIGNVYARGRGMNLSLDHHKHAPYENLYTDIDLGVGAHFLVSSGGAALGRHTAAGATFWNIRGRETTAIRAGFGPAQINFVATPVSDAQVMELQGRWVEHMPAGALQPRDLHAAMLRRRLMRESAAAH